MRPNAKLGILPRTLIEQVKNTAAWLWDEPAARSVTSVLDRIDDAERARATGDSARPAEDRGSARPAEDKHSNAYLHFMLAAHYATVATFVPTDVDARIRHHVWASLDMDALAAATEVVDEIASADVRLVSARFIDSEEGPMSGHDGEWFSVRAGALGRAIEIGADTLVEQLTARIDAEVAREERVLSACVADDRSPAGVQRALSATTIVAHNLGDLSRVVEAWSGPAARSPLRARFARLGHADAASPRPVFAAAGAANKALMARENHRFLPLRRPRALRSARALLLPIGPWFDAWGELVGRDDRLEERDRADVAAALLEVHAADPQAQGCLRALAGMHRVLRGGLDSLSDALPARLRKDVARGAVREAMDISAEHFAVRMKRRYELHRDHR